ncbi:hypothetical protein ACO2Q3_25835 [Caulobacter sp. KR2-114]|uniref:hypothetical protein n=1 Tax=Caulobacter sp. KR2-114 TaxID=3400912 RepID=UPI003C109F0C
MPTDPMDLDPQHLWQSQPTEYDPMTLAQIHHEAERLQTRVRRRNLREYLAGAIGILFFAPVVIFSHSWMMQAGAAWVIAAVLYILWRLSRVGPSRGAIPAAETQGAALVDFQRAELTRQRDALRSVGTWYLAPVLPGFALILLGRWFGPPAAHRTAATDHLIIVLAAMIAALMLLVVWLLNQRGADRLQRRIDEL